LIGRNVHSLSDLVSDAAPVRHTSTLRQWTQQCTDSQADPRASLALVENAVGTCVLDPDDPLCVKLTLSGRLEEVPGGSAEFEAALAGVFRKHPEMRRWPARHGFALFALRISDVFLIDFSERPRPSPSRTTTTLLCPRPAAGAPLELPRPSLSQTTTTLLCLQLSVEAWVQVPLPEPESSMGVGRGRGVSQVASWEEQLHVLFKKPQKMGVQRGMGSRGMAQARSPKKNNQEGHGSNCKRKQCVWEGIQHIKALASSALLNNVAVLPDSIFARARPNPVPLLPPSGMQ